MSLQSIRPKGRVTSGKRAGSRRGAKPSPSLNRPALILALLITVCVVAWGYLVYLAIDFGTAARSGQSGAWGLLVLSSVGAVACLFAGLLLVSRLLRALGMTSDPDDADSPPPPTAPRPPRVPGGRRAAR